MMGDSNSFCLKWNKYSEVFLDTFSHLWSSQEFADVTLFCDGRILRCHRVVLSACSSYFQAMLTGNTHPNPIIFLSDIRFEDLQALIQFVYTGVVTVSQERLSAVVKVGEALKIKGLGESSDSDEIQTEELNKRCVSERQNSSEGETSLKRRRVESNNQVYTSVLPVLDQDAPSSLANTKLPTNDVLLQSAECEESLLEDIEDTHHLSVKEEFRDIEIESSESFGLVNSPDEESYNESKQQDQSSFNNSSFVAGGEASGSQNLATVNSQGYRHWRRRLPTTQDMFERVDFEPSKRRCTLCGALVYRTGTTVHLRSKHKNFVPFVCILCSRRFRKEDTLNEHVKAFHETSVHGSKSDVENKQ